LTRILVTGASGYIGLPTLAALRAMGHEIHVLGRTAPAIGDPACDGAACDDLIFHAADLLVPDALDAAVRAARADTLLHLAWSVPPGRFWTDLANLDWVAASLRLFRAFADQGGRRIVGVGSCAEYDWSAPLLSERETPLAPATLYGQAKASLWALLDAMARQEGLSAAWGRLFFLYGPREPRGKLVADTVAALLAGDRVATTEGRQCRDFIHVADAGRALARLATTELAGPVNIASGACLPVRALLEAVEAETGVPGMIDYGARPLAPHEPMHLAADMSRLRDELGFVPDHDLASGIAATVRWWREAAR
jgi:nucleoside-diphosphate-sugar epimerase